MKITIRSERFCVYSHSTSTRGVFYIGTGTSARPFTRNRRSAAWQQVFDEAGQIEVDILFWTDNRKTAFEIERQLISDLRPICNIRKNPSTSDVLKRNVSGITAQRMRARGNRTGWTAESHKKRAGEGKLWRKPRRQSSGEIEAKLP